MDYYVSRKGSVVDVDSSWDLGFLALMLRWCSRNEERDRTQVPFLAENDGDEIGESCEFYLKKYYISRLISNVEL